MSPSIAQLPLLGPLVGLSTWTFAMEGLLYWRRTPALSKYGVSFDPETAKKQKAEKLPAFVHLLNVKDKVTVRLAWGYVGLRVIHSLIHVSYNNLLLRFPTFAASSIVLLGITAKAAWELFY
ncbi:membrane-associated eicosanoid glutathione metabolism [Fusarium pseudocircinatum]|uniref:Membrane-associated eicosanoid glutathione metabolism n=1 Tax=Fusarium pseudocircinatum TaxID=56676 RepID=A0A8H5KKL1_9HYPO|nr:membrane-associated eicosanoid glutathione metabolism [Fusarium pseudocircinatum]